MAMNLDYLTHVRDESARFVEAIRSAPADAQVPTCQDWTADDLLWHLGEVQWFWATIVREALTDPSSVEHPDRPADRDGLLGFFGSATADLQRALADTAPDEPRWTWSADQTAGFIRRRQAHEALIHRVDAELTADLQRWTMDPALATDGVDEALRIMFGGVPEWGHTEPESGATLRVRASDTGGSWLVTLGRFTGTDPDGRTYDEPDIVVADADPVERAAGTVTGTAADLDCWLWGRPTIGSPERSGDQRVHERFQRILDQGIT
jgi:uncharacterized protein (TIGR03083 family)